MNPCNTCMHCKMGFQGMYCEKERELEERHGYGDLGFPLVGPSCPHYKEPA